MSAYEDQSGRAADIVGRPTLCHMRTFLWKSPSDPMQPSRQSAPRLIAHATAAFASPDRKPSAVETVFTCLAATCLVSWIPSAAAVRAGDDFKQVTVRVFEVDTASAVVVIDLT